MDGRIKSFFPDRRQLGPVVGHLVQIVSANRLPPECSIQSVLTPVVERVVSHDAPNLVCVGYLEFPVTAINEALWDVICLRRVTSHPSHYGHRVLRQAKAGGRVSGRASERARESGGGGGGGCALGNVLCSLRAPSRSRKLLGKGS